MKQEVEAGPALGAVPRRARRGARPRGDAVGRLSLGPTIDRFEEAFAEKVGAPYAAAVSSGTAGLHLLCIPPASAPGDEVITSPYSFAASRELLPLRRRRRRCSPTSTRGRSTSIRPRSRRRSRRARRRSSRSTSTAIRASSTSCARSPTSTASRSSRTRARRSARRTRDEPLGSHGPSAVFAFYPNKQMTTGEGGIVTTHSEEEWRLLRSLRNQGRGDEGGWLEHVRLGFNYRLDDVSAALGLGQVEKLDEILALRARRRKALQRAARRHRRRRAAVRRRRRPRALVVRLRRRAARQRDARARDRALEREGIGFNRYLPSIHLQPYMRERYGFREGLCPVSEDVSSRTLALPFFTALEREQQERVAEALAARAVNVTSVDSVESFVTKDGSFIRELHHTEAQALAEATLEPDQATERHYHRASEEIYFVVKGPATWKSTASTSASPSGDAVLIPAGAWHSLQNNGTSELRILCAARRRTRTTTRTSSNCSASWRSTGRRCAPRRRSGVSGLRRARRSSAARSGSSPSRIRSTRSPSRTSTSVCCRLRSSCRC